MNAQLFGDSTAVLSDDGVYRYELTRRWRDGDLMLWIMLNPSTADASGDDPTIRRCISFAKREDAAGIAVVNLFALRATDPSELIDADDPIGVDNTPTIRDWLVSDEVSIAVAAWGAWELNTPVMQRRARPFVEKLAQDVGRNLVCLGLTKFGAPRHPLYVKADQPFVPFGAALNASGQEK